MSDVNLKAINCDKCGKLVHWNENYHRYVNLYNYPRNKQGELHRHYEEHKINCNRCRKDFDSNYHYQCPICFKQVCQRCENLFLWTADHNKCPRCHYMCSGTITMTVYVKDHLYRSATKTEIELQIKRLLLK